MLFESLPLLVKQRQLTTWLMEAPFKIQALWPTWFHHLVPSPHAKAYRAVALFTIYDLAITFEKMPTFIDMRHLTLV